MLKTNSKKAIENIKQYIMDCTESYFDDAIEWAAENNEHFKYKKDSFTNRAAFILECMNNEFSWMLNPVYMYKHKIGYYNVFEEWGRGLACGGLFDFLLCRAVDDLGAILEESEQEKNKFTQEQAEQKLFYLLYREITKGNEKYKKEVTKK